MTPVVDQRFPRSMRLKRRRLIAPLFERSSTSTRSLTAGKIRILYRFVSRSLTGIDSPLQIGFASSRCRSAVQRNQRKRQMRETIRMHQHLIPVQLFPPTQTLTMMVVARGAGHVDDLSGDLLQAMHLLHQKIKHGD